MMPAADIRDWAAQTWHYLHGLGLVEGLRFSRADIRRRRELRAVRLGGYRLWLRTASSDFRVAEGILLRNEYSAAWAENPRIILDVGANIGAAAVYFAARYPAATVYAIEPEEDNFRVLERNCAPWKNIVPVRQAIWSCSMAREIQNRKTGAWGYTVADLGSAAAGLGQTVACTSIPDFMRQHGLEQIDILKIDIEGGEKEIFEHADGWIDRVGVLVAELHDRICPGCTAAFERATGGFPVRQADGEKVVARRSARS